jgi:uncharacterized protein YjbI with pentapeptide repeats
MEDIHEDRVLNRKNRRRGKAEEQALIAWAEVTGLTALDRELLVFLKSQLTYQEMAHQARNAEEALLVANFCCALAINKCGCPFWPSPTSLSNLLNRLNQIPSVTLQCLGWLGAHDGNLNQHLLWTNLGFANLAGTNLRDAELFGANLFCATLTQANLANTTLMQAELDGAQLEGANLEGARLHRANLQGARLEGANLRGRAAYGQTSQGPISKGLASKRLS